MFDALADRVTEEDLVAAGWRARFWELADEPESEHSPARVEPSGWLALELDADTADTTVLDDTELVDAIIAFDHVSSWAAARQARLLVEFARRRPGDDPAAVGCDRPGSTSRWAPDEIGLALGLSRLTAKNRIVQAAQLAEVLPDTLAAWEAGRLDVLKVRAICEATFFLSPEDAAAVQDRVLPRARQQSHAQLRAALARAVAAVDPEGAAARHREARKGRRVVLGDEKEGMASLWALLSAPAASSAYQWLSRLARGLGAEDPRGMDARRADLLVELLTGQLTVVPDEAGGPASSTARPVRTEPAGDDNPTGDNPTGDVLHEWGAGTGSTAAEVAATDIGSGRVVAGPVHGADARPWPATPGKPLIHIVMPHSTLIGADDHPAELVGYGPIPADVARDIAADAVWKRLVTDPLSGVLLDHGRTTYRPPAALSDFVRARDVTCRLPTCRRRTLDTELDHHLAWAEGGTTSEQNLWGGCAGHHHLKHDAGWTVALRLDGGMTWTTPTGHSYTSESHDYRMEPLCPVRARAPDEPASVPRTGGPGLLQQLDRATARPTDDDDEAPF